MKVLKENKKNIYSVSKLNTPYVVYLELLSYCGGFPLNIRELRSWMPYFGKPTVHACLSIFLCLFIIVANVTNDTLMALALNADYLMYMNVLAQQQGIFLTDLLIIGITQGMGMLTSVCILFSLAKLRQTIAESYLALKELENTIKHMNNLLALKNKTNVKCGVMLCLAIIFTSLGSVGYYHLSLELASPVKSHENFMTLTISFGFLAIANFFTFANPLVFGITILFLDFSTSYINLSKTWKDNLKRDKRDSVICTSICHLADEFNKTLSTPLYLVLCHNIICGVCCLYGATGILMDSYYQEPDYQANFSLSAGLMTWTYFWLALVTLGSLYQLGGQGTNVSKAGIEAAKAFEDAYLLSDQYEEKVTVVALAERLRQSSKFRPFNAFEVSHGTNISLINSFVAFMVVLLQFRLAER